MLRRALLVALLGAIHAPAVSGQTTVRHYRYEVLTRPQDFAYVDEVASEARGRHHAVETDAQGRIVRTAVMRGGRKISERVYELGPDARAARGYETFTNGEKTGRVRIQRSGAGDRTREDYFTVAGALTGYTLYSYDADSVRVTTYTSAGKKRAVSVLSYSPAHTLARETTYSNPDDQSFYVVSDIDERTGLRKGSSQYEDGTLSSRGVFSYDGDGDLIRQDMFDSDGTWFAAAELFDGLTTKRLYDSSKELRYAYDETRRLKETTLFYEAALVCRFTYDRHANGTIKRTLAFGPDGALWAEYPDTEVLDVRQNGRPINGRPATIRKQGNWY
jgi:hypothetical protein